jgi:Tfp pilus assembly protein PilX
LARKTSRYGLIFIAINMQKGFTILFSVLILSVILTASYALYSVVARELIVASTLRDAKYAFYAAETGMACARFWRSNRSSSPSFDSYNPNEPGTPTSITCDNQLSSVGSSPTSQISFSLTTIGRIFPVLVDITNTVDGMGNTFNDTYDSKGNNVGVSRRKLERKIARNDGVGTCPLTPLPGDFVIDFQSLIGGNAYGAAVVGDTIAGGVIINPPLSDPPFVLPTAILPGIYNVTLVSYDDHSHKRGQIQPQEQFHLLLYSTVDGSGPVITTPNISELPQFCERLTETVAAPPGVPPPAGPPISILTSVVSVRVRHPLTPGNANSIGAICALFSPTVSAPPPVIPFTCDVEFE